MLDNIVRKRTKKFKVMVVEDDPAVQIMLGTYLSANGGRVKVLGDGKKLLRECKKRHPDIILLDVVLPGDDGFILLRKLRGANIATPVIMLTERSAIDDRVRGLDVGADDYVTKPFSSRELLARIQNQLRRSDAPLKPMLVGGITVDPATREARGADGKLLALTKTEFDILLYMVIKSPQVLEYSELFTALGYTPRTESKVLVMHIANIRRKLGCAKTQGTIHIQSVAKIGYRLTTEER
jgi:DNA-binding response OmpR family regulator